MNCTPPPPPAFILGSHFAATASRARKRVSSKELPPKSICKPILRLFHRQTQRGLAPDQLRPISRIPPRKQRAQRGVGEGGELRARFPPAPCAPSSRASAQQSVGGLCAALPSGLVRGEPFGVSKPGIRSGSAGPSAPGQRFAVGPAPWLGASLVSRQGARRLRARGRWAGRAPPSPAPSPFLSPLGALGVGGRGVVPIAGLSPAQRRLRSRSDAAGGAVRRARRVAGGCLCLGELS